MKDLLNKPLRLPSRISPSVGPTWTLELQVLICILEMLVPLVWILQFENHCPRPSAWAIFFPSGHRTVLAGNFDCQHGGI